MHGWYSQKMAEGMARPSYGTQRSRPCIYSTPDGGEVTITAVSEKNKQYIEWDDTVYVGEVTKFLRHV